MSSLEPLLDSAYSTVPNTPEHFKIENFKAIPVY
jgi:hypothetical protein